MHGRNHAQQQTEGEVKDEGLYGQEDRGVETPGQNDDWEQVRVGGARAEEQTEKELMAQMTLKK